MKNNRTTLQQLETPNKVHRRFSNDETTQYNFANICSLFQTRENHHLQKIKVKETSSVPTVYPAHRHRHHVTTHPSIAAVADGFQNLTLHPHPQRSEWVTGCLVRGKSYDQVLEETVADVLKQTAQPGETTRTPNQRKCFH